LGLSVAFAAFMVIMIQLNYDYSFGKCHKDSDKIFRAEFIGHPRNGSPTISLSRTVVESFVESSPNVLDCELISSHTDIIFFYVENDDGVRSFCVEESKGIVLEYTGVFTFDFVEGQKDALKTPGNVIIPLSLSRKLFGNESAIGKKLVGEKANLLSSGIKNSVNQTVGAVYRDFPKNTVIKNCIYASVEEEGRGWWDYNVYVRVEDPLKLPLLIENFKRNFDAKELVGWDEGWDVSGCSLRFTALPDIHFLTDVQYDSTPKASKQTLMILFAIAMVIVVIAGINFTNFSTALTPMRVKSINTQRVLGAHRRTLQVSIVLEAIIISLFSYLVAICFISLFNGTSVARLIDGDLSIAANPLVVGGTALIALFTGLFAGLYPARYMTSFAPALVLTGSFGLSPKGKKLRNTLIGFQFIASFTLIIGASFMYLQNHFMQHSPLGFDKDELIVVDIKKILESREVFTNKLKSYSGIEDVAYCETLFANSGDGHPGITIGDGDEREYHHFIAVESNFLKVMGIEITEGRDFRQEDKGGFVFSETARKKYNLELGTASLPPFARIEIIGFIPDVKLTSFRKVVEPTIFRVVTKINHVLPGLGLWAYIKVKAGTDMRAAMSYIHATLDEFDTGYPFEVRFFDEVLQQLYEKEISLSSLISLFSLLAIFISIVGVFGLVVFDSECRRREIGIRKVFGASTSEIIVMFNKTYFRILLICFVIAAPIAWYAVHRWLENFAYKTPMYWWVYLLAFIAVGLIVVCTVTFQNWRAANDNPVETIKTE
jgi:putative ABC transport system permease protein